MKNRKRESCTSGTVRDEDGNILIYSARPCRDDARPHEAGVRKAPRHEIAGEWGTLRLGGRYGDLATARGVGKAD
jgi:hypothetical protein